MDYIGIIEPPSEEAIKAFAEKKNLIQCLAQNYHHPQEDFLIASDMPPVFVVSDGVTLNIAKLIEVNKEYPDPSPAGDVSRIFCQSVVKYAGERYPAFRGDDLSDVFKYANGEVRKYNEKVGKSDVAGNPTGYYSATGSFAVIEEDKAYWASICDSFVAHFNEKMDLKFMSSGSCRPYAVINGEEGMSDYLESGILELKKGDRVFVFTDGFEYYVQNPAFLHLFKDWGDNLKGRITEFSEGLNLKDPEKYGHERSLIAVLI